MVVLALADDLTGALEVGAKFAAGGFDALVTTKLDFPPTPILVIDTETRHCDPQRAAEITRVAAASPGLIYKKTDSTLRGNIGAELGALVEAHPDSPLLYAPAYPAMDRIVKRGHLYIEGVAAHRSSFARDALNPVVDCDIARVIRSQTSVPVFPVSIDELSDLAPGAIYVCDGESDADVEQAARAVTGACRLAAGPAALASALARQINPQPVGIGRWPRITSCLIINGSRHERSMAQLCHAKKLAWPVASVDNIPRDQWVILEGNGVGVGVVARDILEKTTLDALAIFGGDTAYETLQAIGEPRLRPVGEIIPGVPVSRVEGRNLFLITKAGGFGAIGVLPDIRSALA